MEVSPFSVLLNVKVADELNLMEGKPFSIPERKSSVVVCPR